MTTAAASSSGRIPQGEVIQDFADGGSFIRHKLEEAVLELERKKLSREEGQKAAKAMEALNVDKQTQASAGKPEDVDLIVSQTGLTRSEAQEALRANKGDLMTTLLKLVQPRSCARSVDGGAEKKV